MLSLSRSDLDSGFNCNMKTGAGKSVNLVSLARIILVTFSWTGLWDRLEE